MKEKIMEAYFETKELATDYMVANINGRNVFALFERTDGNGKTYWIVETWA